MSFKQNRILMKAFVGSQFEVMKVYEFQTKANFYQDICWISVWSYISLLVSNKSEFIWRQLLGLSLKLCKFTCFKKKRILMKTFFGSQFEVTWLYEFQTKAKSDEDSSSVSVRNYVSLLVSNKSQFLWNDLLSLSLNLSNSTSFKQNRIPMKTFTGSQFEVNSVYEFQTKANSDEDICCVLIWSYLSLRVSNKS